MKQFVFFVLVGSFMVSCKKDEVTPPNTNPIIPPPFPTVDLSCHFSGNFDGNVLEITENVLGYTGNSSCLINSVPPPAFSEARYAFELSSASSSTSVSIDFGSIYFDQTTTSTPTLSTFNNFFVSNLSPSFSLDGANGFQFKFTDGVGELWKSKEMDVNAQTVLFSNVVQESDTTGDYSMFSCAVDCYLYNATLTDSILLQNGILTGWFKL